MLSGITFPYSGTFTSARKGYFWHYTVSADGSVDYMWRRQNLPCTGGWKVGEVTSAVTKECLKDVELKTGRKTDGWNWID